MPTGTKVILILTTEKAAVQELREGLEEAGYRTVVGRSLEDVSGELGSMVPALVLLDRVHYTLESLQRDRSRSTTLFVSVWLTEGRSSEEQAVEDFDAGIDDVLSQPTTRQIVAKVRALFRRRRMQTAIPQVMMRGALHMDLNKHEVRVNGKLVALTPTEFAILQCFLRAPGRVFSRQEMLTRIWGEGCEIGDRTLDVHIHDLRNKIEHNPARPTIIVTVREYGYKLKR